MHQYRITFLGGLAVGYVLGSRAGRERYEQLVRLGRQVAESPAAQQAAGAVQAQAAEFAKRVTDELHDRVPKLAGTLGDHVPGLRRNGSSRHPDGNGSAEAAGDRPVGATGERDGNSG
jgi:hypothetical protein